MKLHKRALLNFLYYLKIIIYFGGFAILFIKPFFSEYFHISNFIFTLLLNTTLLLLIVLPSKNENNSKLLKNEFHFFEKFQQNKLFMTFLIISIILNLAFVLMGLDNYHYIDFGFTLINLFLWGVVIFIKPFLAKKGSSI
jgi:ribose/xylose/arabinose/galactoside ABC-type transport system permease subunit